MNEEKIELPEGQERPNINTRVNNHPVRYLEDGIEPESNDRVVDQIYSLKKEKNKSCICNQYSKDLYLDLNEKKYLTETNLNEKLLQYLDENKIGVNPDKNIKQPSEGSKGYNLADCFGKAPV